jgi:myo-inositol 2-dehydrogenase/D-chiro-inositol 1-dehydrogenase
VLGAAIRTPSRLPARSIAATSAWRHKVKLQVAYWRRFVPALRQPHQRIADGELGALYFLASYQWDGEPPAVRFRANSGGVFVDRGVHEFDQIRWLSGQEMLHLDAAAASVSAGDAESAQVLCALSGGSTALVSLGRRFPLGDVCRVEVFGLPLSVAAGWRAGVPGRVAASGGRIRRMGAWWSPSKGATAADAVAALQAAERASVALVR